MRISIIISLITSFFVLAAPSRKEKAPLFHVTKLGTKLVYKITNNEDISEITDQVVAVENQDEAFIVSMQENENKEDCFVRKFKVTNKGIWSISISDQDYDPPLPRLMLSAKFGEEWETIPNNPGRIILKYRSKILKEETIEVPAGKFRAFCVESTTVMRGGGMTKLEWYAPEVGLVKLKSNMIIKELKSIVPGK